MRHQKGIGIVGSVLSLPVEKKRTWMFILAGLFISLALLSPLVSFASTQNYSSSVSYTVSTSKSGVTTLWATISASGTSLPNPLTLKLVVYFNGSSTPFTSQSCQAATHGGSSGWCTFNIPWQGGGYYKFVASVYSNGNLISQTTIDPLAEPHWANK